MMFNLKVKMLLLQPRFEALFPDYSSLLLLQNLEVNRNSSRGWSLVTYKGDLASILRSGYRYLGEEVSQTVEALFVSQVNK